MPMELAVHKPTCPTRRRPCNCNPEVFPVAQAREAYAACHGDSGRIEHGTWTPPVHVNTIDTRNSQSRRHTRVISD